MSLEDQFNQCKEEIDALALEDVKSPYQPVDEFTGKTETLAVEAKKDKEELEGAGLDASLIDKLQPLAGALRFCQAQWMSQYRARKNAQKEWLEQSPLAYKMRNDLLHHFSFAYRNEPDNKQRVMRIREGGGHLDMIQDLADLAYMGENHPAPLQAIKFEMEKLQEVKNMVSRMSVLLSGANGSKDESNDMKLLRDKAYTLLFNASSKVREYGRYVFWKNPDRKEKYVYD